MELPNRKPIRLRKFDYSRAGAYFITICTAERQHILSDIFKKIVGDDVPRIQYHIKLSHYGKIAEKYIMQLGDFYDSVVIDKYVIMPNHIHIVLFVNSNGTEHIPQHSVVSRFVSTFKRFCNKEYGRNVWQRAFYDHVIRDRKDYDEITKYIYGNPARWYNEHQYDIRYRQDDEM